MNVNKQTPSLKVLRPYLVYVISFVGAGMVSGGVVHYPLNENFYGILAVLGGIIFAFAAIANEILSGNGFPKFAPLLSLVVTSLLLSFGIGMLSGGIQHFTDFPTRAAILIPSGILLSFLAYCVKAKLFQRAAIKKLGIAATLIGITSVVSLIALTSVADGMNTPTHSHEPGISDNLTTEEDHTNHPHGSEK